MITLQEMARLSTLYSQPHRKYHNINHINSCLVELENIPPNLLNGEEREILEYAIWYHDAVYNPYSKNNEANSILLIPGNNSELDFEWSVRQAIEATAFHIKTQVCEAFDEPRSLTITTRYMLDIDLSGFGKPLFEFATNSANIRCEYYNTTLRDFLNGRLNFYKELAKRETLYYTDYFRDKYHKKSQENLKWEMNLIEHTLAETDLTRWGHAMEDALEGY